MGISLVAKRMLSYLHGDCRHVLPTLPERSVHCCVTSPPYWGLRDYGVEGQLGHEPTPGAYVANLVEVFRLVKRVLRDDGTLWLNLGDSYASAWAYRRRNVVGQGSPEYRTRANRLSGPLKEKDLVGIPWRVALALQADGWYLRSEIIWNKPNATPESVTDRPTRCHEALFLLSKQPRYFYDEAAIREPWAEATVVKLRRSAYGRAFTNQGHGPRRAGSSPERRSWVPLRHVGTRNKRTVWTVATQSYHGAHFAVFPPELIRPCVRAGCPVGGTVLDPFAGSGTTGLVAEQESRNAVLIELNPRYVELQRQRTAQAPLLVA